MRCFMEMIIAVLTEMPSYNSVTVSLEFIMLLLHDDGGTIGGL